jgi:serine/threonine protein phosphatase PrpC
MNKASFHLKSTIHRVDSLFFAKLSAVPPITALSISHHLHANHAAARFFKLAAVAAAIPSLSSNVASKPGEKGPEVIEKQFCEVEVTKYGIAKPAAAGLAKARANQNNENINNITSSVNKNVWGAGDDACFISEDSFYGVADGVGGWSMVPHANAAQYSFTLMKCAHQYVQSKLAEQNVLPNRLFSSSLKPEKILEAAYSQMTQHNITGSTTACIVAYDKIEQKLHWANLGDSGFVLIRDNSIVARAKIKQHKFNCPYQLGTGSPDQPSDAAIGSTEVKESDFLVLATDGFFDNVHEQRLLKEVQNFKDKLEEEAKAKRDSSKASDDQSQAASNIVDSSNDSLAQRLTSLANQISKSPNADTPFGRECFKNGLFHKGGKQDDITVVVVQFKAPQRSKL